LNCLVLIICRLASERQAAGDLAGALRRCRPVKPLLGHPRRSQRFFQRQTHVGVPSCLCSAPWRWFLAERQSPWEQGSSILQNGLANPHRSRLLSISRPRPTTTPGGNTGDGRQPPRSRLHKPGELSANDSNKPRPPQSPYPSHPQRSREVCFPPVLRRGNLSQADGHPGFLIC